MWAIFLTYRIFGKSFTKFIAIFIILCVYPWARPVRAALRKFARILAEASGDRQSSAVGPFKIMLNFAWAMVDKMDTCCFKTSLPKITVKGDEGWMKCGCFLLSTHVGCIEILPAMGGQTPWKAYQRHVHAFQQLGRDAIYTSVFVRHLDKSIMTLHAVEEIGVETAVEMQEAIKRGEIVLMAGDRLPAGASRTAALKHEFLGRECSFPKGVFRFAKLMECPVYAITCVRTGWNAYEVEAKRIGEREEGRGKREEGRGKREEGRGKREEVLLGDYVRFLESAARRHPDQWYQFYDFFA
jgi:predicted LPLAT superfamily acyltransferase